jgi:hypothetical protein
VLLDDGEATRRRDDGAVARLGLGYWWRGAQGG